jgi:integrase
MGYDMLSKTKIQKLRIGSKVCEGDGLYFKKTKADRGQWSYRYTSSGKSHEIGLGAYPIIDLLEARRLRDDNRRLRAQGKDPHFEKAKAQRLKRLKANTRFSDVAEEFIKTQEPQWRNEKSAQAWRNTLSKYVYPVLDKWPLEQLEMHHVLEVLKPIWSTKSETARRIQQRIARVFDYARAHNQFVGENPADWERSLRYVLPSLGRKQVNHHAAMPYKQLPQFFQELSRHDCISARALEFTILTAARTKEVTMAVRSETDFSQALWSIPAQRMKTNMEHIVPLSAQASSIFGAMMRKHNEKFIFRGVGRSGYFSNNSMRKFLQQTMGRYPYTVHGFRSSFRVWAAEQKTYDRLAIEFSLAHKIKDSVEAAYMRSNLLEERRLLMQDWANFCFSERDK